MRTHGKHLFLGLGEDAWLHIHLGRFGRFHWHAGALSTPAVNVRLRMVTKTMWVDLVGPIACTVLDDAGMTAVLERLGPDPLQADADSTIAFERLRRTTRPIGQVLMDQAVIAGIGNIYRAEVLWRSRVNPYRPANLIERDLFDVMWADTRALLQQGVTDYAEHEPTHTVGLTLPDGTNPVPVTFGRRNRTQVYQRDGLPCARCGNLIVKTDMGGRTLFYCPMCQAT